MKIFLMHLSKNEVDIILSYVDDIKNIIKLSPIKHKNNDLYKFEIIECCDLLKFIRSKYNQPRSFKHRKIFSILIDKFYQSMNLQNIEEYIY